MMTRAKDRAWMAELRRACRIVFLERRPPGKFYKIYYDVLKRCGVQFVTMRLKNGLVVKAYTHCFSMFYEVWNKRDYDIPGFTIGQDMTVIDIGANQGFFTLYAASKGATVYAFEPCAENFAILQWNVSKNGLQDRVRLVNAAVTDQEGESRLYVGVDNSGHIMSGTASIRNEDRGGAGVQVRVTRAVTLDSILRDPRVQRCDFLKIDCEGSEYDILAGLSEASFKKIARTSIECHEDRMQEAVDMLTAAGFDIVDQTPGEAGMLKATNRLASS